MPQLGRYWFPAKRYGWGWGPPVCWQGWLVLTLFLGLLLAGLWWFPPAPRPLPYVLYTPLLNGLLILVCWFKGEPPRWRWGK